MQPKILGNSRGVVPGGAGGAIAPPDFGRSVNLISTKGGRLCPPNNTDTHGFSELPTALNSALQCCPIFYLSANDKKMVSNLATLISVCGTIRYQVKKRNVPHDICVTQSC